MSASRPGSDFLAFASRGIRSVASPRIRNAAIAAVVMAASGALVAGSILPHSAPAPVAVAAAPAAAPAAAMSYEDAVANQAAFRSLVETEAARYGTPGLAETMLGYVRLVQANRSPADRASDAMYGLDDGQWAWMMRQSADAAGLSGAMDGIHVNGDGTVDAPSAQALQNFLALKNDVRAATKLVAAWLDDEARQFEAQSGKAAGRTDLAMIMLGGDEEAARDAAFMAKEHPDAKLGDELTIRESWKRPLFVDRKGWMGARAVVAALSREMADAAAHAQDPLPPGRDDAKLDEDLTVKDFRQAPDRLASIVVRTLDQMSSGSPYGLHASRALDKSGEELAPAMAVKLLTLAGSIDKLRGDDLSGGVYAIGPGQWIQAVAESGDSPLQAEWSAGVEMHKDGSVHAKSAEAFGALMRLRDDTRIATQIVATRMALQMDTLKKDTGHTPDDATLLMGHLFGVAAAEDFGRAVAADGKVEAPCFAGGDPRNAWAPAFALGGGGAAVAARKLDNMLATFGLFSAVSAASRVEAHLAAAPEHDAAASMRP